MKKKIKVALLVLIVCILELCTNAIGYQSIYNNGDWKPDGQLNWIRNIRDMEVEGGILGLNETINENTYESSSGSNKLDVHMVKNTEFGTMEILAVSQYGKQPDANDTDTIQRSRWIFNTTTGSAKILDTSTNKIVDTTTGNKYGIYLISDNSRINWVFVSVFPSSYPSSTTNAKYINRVNFTEGDAMNIDWQGRSTAYRFDGSDGFIRSFNGSLCNYTGATFNRYNCMSYACIVNGEGI